jgi:hypothetical protein
MSLTNKVDRTLGTLLLLHVVVGLTVPFILLHVVTSSRGFLLTASENAGQVRLAVFLLTVGSAMTIAVSASALPVFRRYSLAMTFWLLALATAGFTLHASAGPAREELFQSLAIVVGSARKWAHYTYLLVAVSWIFLLFTMLFRFRLVPRSLAAFGMIASVLQIIGVTLRGMMGYAPETRLAMPLAPAYVALAVWLIVKGLNERPSTVEVESCEAGVAHAS